MIFKNDVSRNIHRGQKTEAFVTNVREDGKIDLRLDRTGYVKIDSSAEKLLSILEKKKVLNLHDKSDPDDIREALGMSKKTFKQAIGQLYKKRLIVLGNQQIKLAEVKD